MKIHFYHRFFSIARRVALFHVLAIVFFLAPLAPPVFAAEAREAAAIEHTQPADPGSQHPSVVRSGKMDTKDGLTLRLTTDLGSVNIVQLEAGAAPVVRYTVRIETDARNAAAQQLLDSYSLKARSISSGVEINGMLPPQAARSADAQFWVQFEVAVPRGYSVEVNTGAGDITTGDIGGTAALQTQGGNIKTGRIGASGLREASWGRSAAKLETEGGHIQVLDVAGDLTAFTGGGHINVANIAGDASLRTGGGHIRAGQIGGRAELETAGGNITVAHAGNFVSVRTGGGQIDFGEVRGHRRSCWEFRQRTYRWRADRFRRSARLGACPDRRRRDSRHVRFRSDGTGIEQRQHLPDTSRRRSAGGHFRRHDYGLD